MKTAVKTIPGTVSLFFTVLFSYAVTVKVFHFKSFSSQLEMAPGLEGWGKTTALIIIAVQIFITILLCFRHKRLTGLWLPWGCSPFLPGISVISFTTVRTSPVPASVFLKRWAGKEI